MYQVSRVQTALSGLIGWKQPSDGSTFVVSAGNLATSSGLYFPDFSPLCESQNVYFLQGDDAITDNNFNTVLSDIVKASMMKVLSNVFLQDDFCESKWLFPYENVWTEVLENDAYFVGYRIVPPKGNYLVKINSVQTTFDGVGSVKILLFHSSKKSPLQTKTITTVANDTVETVLDWDLPYDYGTYYIGYLRGALSIKAVDRDWQDASIMTTYKTIRIESVCVAHTTEVMFDLNNLQYSDETYGLNFNISTWKDFTMIVEKNKTRFTNALGLQVATDVADMMIKSTRSNFTERNMKAVAMLEKEGLISADPNAPKVNSLVNRLKSELRDLRKTLAANEIIKMGTL